MKRDWQAEIAKWGAVMTAAPRWVGAMMEAEGVPIPVEWQHNWRFFVFLLSAGMAITEALSFAYIFTAWRTQRDKKANWLLVLAFISAIIFIAVLAPYIAAQVRSTTLDKVLTSPYALWGWSIAVAASTIMIVASVGYAQKYKGDVVKTTKTRPAKVSSEKVEKGKYSSWKTKEERREQIIRFCQEQDPEQNGLERETIFAAIRRGNSPGKSTVYEDVSTLIKKKRLKTVNSRLVTWMESSARF